MDSRGLRSKIIIYIYHDRVSHSGLNWRTWPLPIDSYYLPREAIWCSSYVVDAPIVCYCARQSDWRQREKKNESYNHIGNEWKWPFRNGVVENISSPGRDLQAFKAYPRNAVLRWLTPPLFLVPCGLHYRFSTLARVTTPIAKLGSAWGESIGFGSLHYIMSAHWYKERGPCTRGYTHWVFLGLGRNHTALTTGHVQMRKSLIIDKAFITSHVLPRVDPRPAGGQYRKSHK